MAVLQGCRDHRHPFAIGSSFASVPSLSARSVSPILFKICGLPGNPEKVVSLKVEHQPQIIFFVTGFYMDIGYHNVVAEMYFFDITPEHRESRAKKSSNERLDM